MGDKPGPGSKGIPAWQRVGADSSVNSSSTAEEESSTVEGQQQQQNRSEDSHGSTKASEPLHSSSDELLDQAKRFLQDESVRNQPMQQKVAFLQSKGLSSTEIGMAMGISLADFQANSGTATSHPSSTEPAPFTATATKPVPLNRETPPPIITYPEFLTHAEKPPPIITAIRLLNTAYIAGAVTAAFYGASRYLVAPMTESLTSARHDFATHVQQRVDELITRLGAVVSSDPTTDPASLAAHQQKSHHLPFRDVDAVSEEDFSDSDPTELFHRDFGTQTSPSLDDHAANRTFSPLSASSSNPSEDKDATEAQYDALRRISKLCATITDEHVAEGSSASEISSVVKVLNEQLESLAYPSYTIASNGTYTTTGGIYARDGDKRDQDEIAKMKAEIRGVKGVLLSARNFPAGGGGRRALFPPAAAQTVTQGT